MEVQSDFKELLALLNKYNVTYMIVGGYALAFHGAPRYTGDIDIYIKPDKVNASKIIGALNEFGFAGVDLREDDFIHPNKVIQLGVPPVRIDIITSITGVEWDSALQNRVPGQYGEIAVHFIGRSDFIRNKRSTGRYKDLADLEALGVDPDGPA
jgi:hypothetical protein